MSEFYEISPKALALAEESQSFQLQVPEDATTDRDGITKRWTDHVTVEALDRGVNPNAEKHQVYFEFSVRFDGEGKPDNVGTLLTRRTYVNTDVLRDEKRMRIKNKEDGQAGMTQRSLARIAEFMRAMGKPDDEAGQYFTIDSPFVGQKCWVEVIQRPSTKENRKGMFDIEITRFLPE